MKSKFNFDCKHSRVDIECAIDAEGLEKWCPFCLMEFRCIQTKRIYVTHLQDRHCDHQSEVFTTKEAAIKQAKEWVKAATTDRPYETEEITIQGWVYYARYGSEGDCVWVEEKCLKE